MQRQSPQGFSSEEFEYYSRQIVLKEIGLSGQRKLKNAKVCVVGAGGLGSPILTQLASMGIGTLRVIDRDVVEISNLQRQHLYGINVIGVPKVEAAQKRLAQLNPFIKVEPIPMSISSSNAEKLLEGVDIIVDALDSMKARYAINRASNLLMKPLVHGAVIMEIGSATTIIPQETPCIECFQGEINDENIPNCAVMGVHPSIINLIASIQVSEVVKIVLGKEPALANYLLFADLNDLSLEKIRITKAESCPVCGINAFSKNEPIVETRVEEICGREGRRVFIFSPDTDLKLDLDLVNSKIRKQDYTTTVRATMGSTFIKREIKGSILVSGVTIIEGAKNQDEAFKIRESLIP
jgi:molybdopterin/thiamine biosynthesis adenylyltransferase